MGHVPSLLLHYSLLDYYAGKIHMSQPVPPANLSQDTFHLQERMILSTGKSSE